MPVENKFCADKFRCFSDPHPEYFLLAGRDGGQIANGGTGAGEDLYLYSTSDATKGNIFLDGQQFPNTIGTEGQVLTSIGGVIQWTDNSHTFLSLTDTISSYTVGRLLFESNLGVTDSDKLVWTGSSLLIDGNLNVTGMTTDTLSIAGITENAILIGGPGSSFSEDFANISWDNTNKALDVNKINLGGTGDYVGIINSDTMTGAAANVLASSLGIKNYVDNATGSVTFLGLTDTPGAYNTDRIYFQTGSAVTDSANFAFSGTQLRIGQSTYDANTTVSIKGNTSGGTGNIIVGKDSGGATRFQIDDEGRIIAAMDGPNTAIGDTNTLISITTGTQNFALGPESGRFLTEGNKNTFVGDQAGRNMVGTGGLDGSQNVAMGSLAMWTSTTTRNSVAIGQAALYFGTDCDNVVAIGYNAKTGTSGQGGANSVFVGSEAGFTSYGSELAVLGYQAGFDLTTANWVTAIGSRALTNLTTGNYNLAVGYNAGAGILTSFSNTILGSQALESGAAGNGNVVIGMRAARNITGAGNILIGWQCADGQVAISNQLWIENSSSSTPLLGGDFSLNKISINGTIPLGTDATLKVTGDIDCTTGYKINGTAGASGTFTTADAKTVTVTNGIITAIV